MEKPTKNASGFPNARFLGGAITQRGWRTALAGTMTLAGLMAWYGSDAPALQASLRYFVIYWGIFFLLLLISLYLIVLDFRFIHVQYLIARRDLLRETLEDEAFRKVLIGAQQEKAGSVPLTKPISQQSSTETNRSGEV